MTIGKRGASMNTWDKSKLKKHIILLFLPVLLIVASAFFAAADSGANNIIHVKENWEYRFGDSPKNSVGFPEWAADNNSEGWETFSYPGQPANVNNLKDVWLRVRLPEQSYRDPSVFFVTNDQLFEVYIDNELIYKFGDVTDLRNIAPGSPWHLISLPDGYEGKLLYFRMHTVFPPNAGLLRVVKLASAGQHISAIIKENLHTLILSVLFIFIGLVLIFIYLTRRDLPAAFASLGFFAICFGFWIISETHLKQLFLNAPRFWLYAALGSFYLMPAGFYYFVEQLFIQSKWSFISIVRRAFLVFVALCFALDIMMFVPIIYTLKYYYIFLITGIAACSIVIGRAAIQGNKEAKIFSYGFAFLSLFGIYDIFGWYFRVVPWTHFVVQYGMFAFILTLVFLLGRRVALVYDQLKIYSDEIVQANEDLNKMYLEVNESRDKLAHWNRTLEQTVAARTASMRNLLDNASQGFLSFGKDLIVNADYSYECTRIFGMEIINKCFPDLVYHKNKTQRDFLHNLLVKILNEDVHSERQKYIPLLPEEVSINGKFIHVEYKIINTSHNSSSELFMVILTDITDKRHLESQMEQERNILKMVVKVIANYNDFSEVIADYSDFCSKKLDQILKNKSSVDDKYFEIFRGIHTFKGSFSQFEMVNITNKLHELESELSKLKLENSQITVELLKDSIMQQKPERYLDRDLEILKSILGEQFLRQESTLVVDKTKLMEIEKKMLIILSPYEYKLLLPDVQRLRYRPFREVLKGYPDYVSKLAERQEKLIYPVEVTGGEILVDLDRYGEFSKVLIHVFRNIIDHGIESPEERFRMGKHEYGIIKCSMDIKDNSIILAISDDGKGIDINKIKYKAIEQALYSEEELSLMTRDEIMQLIFLDQLSTKDVVSELSGRGFGLAAVKSQTEKIGGIIKVTSQEGLGTEFVFILPFDESNKLPEISASSIINPVIETTKYFLMEQTRIPVSQFKSITISQAENIILKEYTAMVNIKGVLAGRFVISMDYKLVKNIAKNFILGEVSPDEEQMYMEDVLAECSNIILGNSIKMFPELENLVVLEPPITLNIKDASIRFMEATTWVCSIECDWGSMDINFSAADIGDLN
ncbi:MAG: ATP-binding protein [Bacillota bacterium]